jgi:hypothetical protein
MTLQITSDDTEHYELKDMDGENQFSAFEYRS